MQSARKYNNVLLCYRIDTPQAAQLAEEITQWLSKKEINCYSFADQIIPGATPTEDLEVIDLCVVLGGDGTYLEAVRKLNGFKRPILGVNQGSLGFLTVVPSDQVYSMLEKALNNGLEMRQRGMLEVEVDGHVFTALNDITLERGSQSQLLNVSVYVDNHLISHLKADGLIFSTPTGSTAYNLAANGPILHPEVKSFVMTPICPHSLTDRPIIFPDNLRLIIEVEKASQVAALVVDGRRTMELKGGQKAIIRSAPCSHYVLRTHSHNYFDLLREKLKFGQRA